MTLGHGVLLIGLVWAQRGIGGIGRIGIGGAYGKNLIGVSARLPLGYSEYTFVEVMGGITPSQVYRDSTYKGLCLGAAMNQAVLGNFLTKECRIYWFLPYIDFGGGAYLLRNVSEPDGRGNMIKKDRIIPDVYLGIGTIFNFIPHFELFGSVRARTQVVETFSPEFDYHVGARISFGY
ncbi:MAG: hypothetical protein ACUVRD_08495 [Bacteroidia bacterium]